MTSEEQAVRNEVLRDIIGIARVRSRELSILKAIIYGLATLKHMMPLHEDEVDRVQGFLDACNPRTRAPKEATPPSRQSWLETQVRRHGLYPSLHVEMGSEAPEPVNLFGLEIWAGDEKPNGKLIGWPGKFLYMPGTYRLIREAIQTGVGVVQERRFISRAGRVFNEYFMASHLGDWDGLSLRFEVLLRVLSPVF